MAKAIFCTVATSDQAEHLVNQLQTIGGVRSQDISVLMPDRTGTREFAHEHNTKAPEGAIAGVSAGGVAGGVLGLLAGIGALAIPGIGPFIAAGPIMATLSGAALGATVGGIAGALVGMGIPEFEAKRFETKVKGGSILLSVHSENGDRTSQIKDMMEKGGAEDVSTTGEKDEKAVTA